MYLRPRTLLLCLCLCRPGRRRNFALALLFLHPCNERVGLCAQATLVLAGTSDAELDMPKHGKVAKSPRFLFQSVFTCASFLARKQFWSQIRPQSNPARPCRWDEGKQTKSRGGGRGRFTLFSRLARRDSRGGARRGKGKRRLGEGHRRPEALAPAPNGHQVRILNQKKTRRRTIMLC